MPDSIVSPASSRPRLKYLDGLRGLAALYVVVAHLYGDVNARSGLQLLALLGKWAYLLNYGRLSVAVFIVLSGYVLMLPVARSADRSLKGGAWDYLKRRARRLIPPYYAALLFALLLMAAVPSLRRTGEPGWDFALPAFGPGSLIAHLLLLHDFSPRWIYKINPPLWSVAVEWQIYWFLPFCLLPLWKKFGLLAMLIAGVALGVAPAVLLHNSRLPASTWFLGLFAMGAAAAVINFSEMPYYAFLRERLRWDWIATGAGIACIAAWLRADKQNFAWMPSEMLAGAFVACLLVSCAIALHSGRTSYLAKVCETRPVALLGAMSYSLYLTHLPVLTLVSLALGHHMTPRRELISNAAIALPLCLAVGWLFHIAIERRFMSEFQRKAEV